MTRREMLLAVLGLPATILTHRAAKGADIGSPIPYLPKATAPAATKPVVTSVLVHYRQPVGHTHTCAAGHVWDHQKNPTHNCQECGRSQYIQDNPWKLVPEYSVHRSPISTTPEESPVRYSLTAPSTVSGGCASGNCSLPTRKGLFR